jgi:hypothetical protein
MEQIYNDELDEERAWKRMSIATVNGHGRTVEPRHCRVQNGRENKNKNEIRQRVTTGSRVKRVAYRYGGDQIERKTEPAAILGLVDRHLGDGWSQTWKDVRRTE